MDDRDDFDLRTAGRSPALLECPICHQQTDSLKCKELPTVLFLFLFLTWSGSTRTACPKCMRRLLGQNTGVNLFTANVIFPAVFLVNAITYLETLRRGHTPIVSEALERPTGEQEQQQTTTITMLAACVGALFGSVFGAFFGLLGGAAAFKIGEATAGQAAADWAGEIGGILGGALSALMLVETRERFRGSLGWILAAAINWNIVRVIGDAYFDWGLLGTGIGWAFCGAVVGVAAGTRGHVLHAVRGGEWWPSKLEIVLIIPLVLGAILRRVLRGL
jgi:hypothetical protein